jgi:hypothetical protein
MPQDLQVRTVNTLAEFRKHIETARKRLAPDKSEELWYRGVSSNEHRLLPSLFRSFRNKKPTKTDVLELESALFFEFLAKTRTGNGTALDHWDVLFLMQHYGVPTRLLDWTEVLYVALYFAVNYRKEGDTPRLYLMNPYRWNKVHGYGGDLYWPRYFGWDPKAKDYYEYGEILIEGGADWEYPCGLYPPQRDARLSAQRGYFTIHGYDARPLDEISPELIAAIDFAPLAVKEVEEELEYSGLNEYALFPDLEGLARHLKKKNALK